jgi:hypothetical protein
MEVFFTFTVFIIVFGSIFLLAWLFSKKARIRRRLKKFPFKYISDFVNGESAKITGMVEFVDVPLTSPLSGRTCAWYYVLVEQRVSSGRSSHWKKIIEEEVPGRFVVRDGNRCALVDERKVKSYIVQDKQFRSGFMNDATGTLEAYLNKHGIKSEGLFGLNKSIRYKEGVLEEGERISVFGKGEWKEAPQLGLADVYGRVLHMRAPDQDFMVLTDDPGAVKK